MLRKLAWLAACSCVLTGPSAHALGLGELKLASGLNQRFQATIPIISAEAGELENLKVRLAPNEAFARAGVERAAYLTSLQMEVVAGGSPHVMVSSDQIAREPLLVLLVEASSGGTRVLREYSILLDPAVMPAGVAAQAAPAYKPPTGIDPNAFVTPPAAQGPAPAPYYPPGGISTQPLQDQRPPQAPAGAGPLSYQGPYQDPNRGAPQGAPQGGSQTPAYAGTYAGSSAARSSGPPVVSYDRAPQGAVPSRRTSPDYYLTPQELAALGAPPAYSAAPLRSRAEPRPEPRRDPSPPVRDTTLDAPEPTAALSGDRYGPVRSGDTLRKVARSLSTRFPGSSNEEIVQLLYVANPRAFAGGDIDRLQRGAMLQIPDSPAAESAPEETPTPAPVEVAAAETAPAEIPAAQVPVAEPLAAAAPAAEAPAPEAAPAATPAPAAPAALAAAAESPQAAVPIQNEEAAEATTDTAVLAEEPSEPLAAAAGAELIEIPGETAASAPPMWLGLIEEAGKNLEQYGVQVDSRGLARAGMWAALVLLLLFALLALRSWRNERAQRAYKKAAKADAMPSKKRIDKQKQDKLDATSARAMAVAAPVSPRQELEALNRTMERGAPKVAAPLAAPARGKEPSLGDTARLKAADLQTTGRFPSLGAPAAAVPAVRAAASRIPDLDITAQFAASTQQIDLGSNDPMAEADFNLAYGLYDEAALLLRQAAEKDPNRRELRVKLAETYFAAGRATEFRQTAESLKPELPAEEWRKLAILGRQLCPGDALFPEDAGSEVGSVDLAFDEPSPVAAPAAPAAPRAEAPHIDPGLDFTLEDIEPPPPAPKAEKAALPAIAAPAKTQVEEIDLDLGEFDLGPAASAGDPSRLSPAAADITRELDALAFDLGDFDSSEAGSVTQPPSRAADFGSLVTAPRKTIDIAPATADFDFGDIDLALEEPESDLISGDEVGTKLDLARAYVEMGDTEMAQGLLNEVLAQGSDAQRKEADELMGRLTV